MHFASILALASYVTAESFTSASNVRASPCGVPPESEGLRAMAYNMSIQESRQSFQDQDVTSIVVPTIVHVVYANETELGGYIPASQIEAQIGAMNDAFSPHGISFDHLNTTYTQNATWTHDNFPGWNPMKRALRQGGYSTLNLYTTLLTDGFGLLGIGTPPDDYYDDSDDFMQDGVVIQANSLPGGIGPQFATHPERYTEGDLANHEVGHWFGLFHTYIERGDHPFTCSNGDNDFVADTPTHLLVLTDNGPDMDCPEGRDTCPDLPGLDPTNNYMSSQWQSCWSEFTPGQGLRARNMWAAYRAGRD